MEEEKLKELEDSIDDALSKETEESLSEWMHQKQELDAYRAFIDYLVNDCIGDKNTLLETFNDNSYSRYVGKVDVTKELQKNDLFLFFEVEGGHYKAEWQARDNYAVWQTGEMEDDYRGYLLFPTWDDNVYFCLYYEY